jgi:hypothetical protein
MHCSDSSNQDITFAIVTFTFFTKAPFLFIL